MNRDILKKVFIILFGLLGTASVCFFSGQRFRISPNGYFITHVLLFFCLTKVLWDTVFSATKREVLFCSVIGVFYALAFSIGTFLEREKAGITFKNIENNIVHIIILAIVFTYCIVWLFRKIESIQSASSISVLRYKRLFLMGWILIFICWMPLFLVFIPGNYSYDVPWQLMYFFTGKYSAHHPILHTIYLGASVKLGLWIFGSSTFGAVLHSLSQMALMSAIFSYVSTVLVSDFKIGKYYYWGLIAFFALYPLNPCFAFTATKDTLFSGFFILTIILLIKALYSDKASNKVLGCFVVSAVLMMLFRNNAVYSFILFAILFLLTQKIKNKYSIGASFFVAVFLYFCVSQSLMFVTNAQETNMREMLSVPIQQVARAVRDNKKSISEDELRTVFEVLGKKNIEEKYLRDLSDPVKASFKQNVFKKDPGKYIKTYISIGKKSINEYLNAFFDLTSHYWYPYTKAGRSGFAPLGYVRKDHYEWAKDKFDVDINAKHLFPQLEKKVRKIYSASYCRDIPVVGLMSNFGFICWVYFFLLGYALFKRDKIIAPFALAFCLWLTCLLGPVMISRYVYPVVLCVPMMTVLVLRPLKENDDKGSCQ